ncbi:glycosyltransferase [Frigoribacterium sp. 2-23]|uniref:glycosyltransferase n=1 Tax=Frigoribacterium sp. 2-23 TaxID=3415006 RepID=UPI003C6F1327
MTAPVAGISVVVCAYTLDRWGDLEASVESVIGLPEAPEVVLVIDHNPALLERSRTRWPDRVVVANEFTQGLSGARNTGVKIASGEIIAFLDDDATADRSWLTFLLQPFSDPAVAGVGGRAVPVWPDSVAAGTTPGMYPAELLWIVGCSHDGLPTSTSDVRNVIGCSMAFRREAILSVGAFNPDTGRVGTIPLGCEETEMCIRIRQADASARIVLEPRAVVRHHVSEPRVTWGYLRRRSFYEGVSKAALSNQLGRGDSLSSEASYLTTVLPKAVLRELGRTGRGGAGRALAIVTTVAGTVLGYAVGSLRRARLSTLDVAAQREALDGVLSGGAS